MEYIEEFDKTKYFLNPNRERIYAKKGQGHKQLAYRILKEIGLDMLYYFAYEESIRAAEFLTYCGYVLVDEAEEHYKLESLFEDECIQYIEVGYCSAAIDENYIEYIKNTYSGENNIIEDNYETADISKKKKIDKIIERIRREMDTKKASQQGEDR